MKLRINMEFDVEADSVEDAFDELFHKVRRENTTIENLFWDNLEEVEE